LSQIHIVEGKVRLAKANKYPQFIMGVLAQVANRNFLQPIEGSACTQSALIFFLLSFGLWVGGGEFFSLFLFPMGSHQVLNMFPRFSMDSPRVFPIAPHFNPICFAQNPLLLTYIVGPKGKAIHLATESFILGEPP